MTRAFLALALAASGCGGVTTASRHTLATARYEPQQRDEVWGRALLEFQRRGVLVAVFDREGGVLTSQQQPMDVPCEAGSCKAVVAQQLTLTAGVATLGTHRSVTTPGRGDVALATEAQYQRETNELLTAIAGSPATPFLAPAPPQPAPPSTPSTPPSPPPTKKPQRAASPCETYQDCPTGSICSDGVCRP